MRWHEAGKADLYAWATDRVDLPHAALLFVLGIQSFETAITTPYHIEPGTLIVDLLPRPLPILMAYWTVATDAEGALYRPDLYRLDAPLLAALERAGAH